MAMPPPRTHSSLGVFKRNDYKLHDNSSLCSCWSSGWSWPLINVCCHKCTPCCHLWSTSDELELIFCAFLSIYLFQCMHWSPKPFHHLWQFDYFLPDLIFRSKLLLHLSSLLKFDTSTNGIKLVWLWSFLTELMANGCDEYHKGYCWPKTFSFAFKWLL